MMLSRVKNLKLNHKYLFVFVFFAFAKAIPAQTDTIQISDEEIKTQVLMAMKDMDTVKPIHRERVLIDGVSGVVGDYVILNSDIKKQQDLIAEQEGISQLSKCELLESLLREKMFAHHAIQDSITVSDAEVEGGVESRIEYFRRQLGGTATDQQIANVYKKNSIEEVRSELRRIVRDMTLANRMQERLTENVEITPEEVREFFYNIPEDERPLFNTEVEIAQIIVKPVPTEKAIQDVIDKLNEMRTDVLENGASFSGKAALHSEDIATERQGGVLSLKRSDAYVKEFKEAAFSLQEGEISEPFETMFGYHILKVDKVRGQVRDVRHILLYPFISVSQVKAAKQKLEDTRTKIILGEMTFAEAAREISDEEETAKNGGKLTNPRTGEAKLDLTKLSEELSRKIIFLEKGDISGVIDEKDPIGRTQFKMIQVIDKIKDHKADYALDFLKIKDIALRDKQVRVVEEWQNEKLRDTYIKIGSEFGECDFTSKWTK